MVGAAPARRQRLPLERPASLAIEPETELPMNPAPALARAADQALSPEQVQARLAAELPHWSLEGGWIRRKVRTGGWKGTLMVVNTVGHLAEAAWHHPDLAVSYAFVTIKLMTHDAKGITDKDFALAAKIESVLMWQPAAEPGAVLEGTPDDPRFKYIKYD
jgi:4a-hydroxytetrahydrobiopterin dehydratase